MGSLVQVPQEMVGSVDFDHYWYYFTLGVKFFWLLNSIFWFFLVLVDDLYEYILPWIMSLYIKLLCHLFVNLWFCRN